MNNILCIQGPAHVCLGGWRVVCSVSWLGLLKHMDMKQDLVSESQKYIYINDQWQLDLVPAASGHVKQD